MVRAVFEPKLAKTNLYIFIIFKMFFVIKFLKIITGVGVRARVVIKFKIRTNLKARVKSLINVQPRLFASLFGLLKSADLDCINSNSVKPNIKLLRKKKFWYYFIGLTK